MHLLAPDAYKKYLNFYNNILNSFSGPLPKVTVVTFKIDPWRRSYEVPKTSNVRVLTGRYLEKIPDEELTGSAPFDLISDVFGVFTYTSELYAVLSKFQRILSKNGTAYIALGDKNSVVFRTLIHSEKGDEPIPEWLAKSFPSIFSIEAAGKPGVRIYKGAPVAGTSRFVLVMKKADEGFQIPYFQNIVYKGYDRGAPSRIFKFVPVH
ncbi:MAG: hypothetical protein KA715_09210 [Xanthomonadaceae bacterium]|nr:hypothetical protein [Xanthomonadaceae bacterium]